MIVEPTDRRINKAIGVERTLVEIKAKIGREKHGKQWIEVAELRQRFRSIRSYFYFSMLLLLLFRYRAASEYNLYRRNVMSQSFLYNYLSIATNCYTCAPFSYFLLQYLTSAKSVFKREPYIFLQRIPEKHSLHH